MDNAPWEIILSKMNDLEKGQQAMALDLGEVKSDVKVANAAMQQLAEKCEKHERMLRGGNGDGLGIAATVKTLTETADEDHDLLYGQGQQPGIKGRMKIAEDGIDALTRLGYLIGGAILASVLSIGGLLLTHNIHLP